MYLILLWKDHWAKESLENDSASWLGGFWFWQEINNVRVNSDNVNKFRNQLSIQCEMNVNIFKIPVQT